MTNFSKHSSSGGFLSAIDIVFQILCLVGTGIASAVLLSVAMHADPAAYMSVVADLPEVLARPLAEHVLALASTPTSSLHAMIFFLQWLALYLPFALSLTLLHLALPGLHRNVRRLCALVLASAYVFICLGALKSGNLAWGGLGLLAFIPSASPTLYQFLRALLFTATALGVCIPFIFNTGREGSRVVRVLIVLGLFVGWVAWDWRQTRSARMLDSTNLSDTVKHRFILLVPQAPQDVLLEALSLPEAQTMKERLLSITPVFPTSTREYPQVATLLSGRLPPLHGIRDEFPPPEAVTRLGALIREQESRSDISTAKAEGTPRRAVYSATPGGFDEVASLFAASTPQGRWCVPDITQRAMVGLLENSPLLAALLPTDSLREIFPSSQCSQRFAPLEELVGLALDDVGVLLKTPAAIEAWISLRPHPLNGWQGLEENWTPTPPTPSALRQLQVQRLAASFQTVADQITSWGLWHNSEVWIVGLGGTQTSGTTASDIALGSVSLHSVQPAGAAPERSASESGALTSQAALSRRLHGEAASTGDGDGEAAQGLPSYYNESPLNEISNRTEGSEAAPDAAPATEDFAPRSIDTLGRPYVRADWMRTALARATRSTLCRVETPHEGGASNIDTIVVSIENGHGPATSRVVTQVLPGIASKAPLEKDAQACAKGGRDALVQVWRADLDLPSLKWDTIASIKKNSPSASDLAGGAGGSHPSEPASGGPHPENSPSEVTP